VQTRTNEGRQAQTRASEHAGGYERGSAQTRVHQGQPAQVKASEGNHEGQRGSAKATKEDNERDLQGQERREMS
jgi:hypothetical protein